MPPLLLKGNTRYVVRGETKDEERSPDLGEVGLDKGLLGRFIRSPLPQVA
jgi:hypothetical protein